ncbi:allophanate hydrolase [Luminiphilus sp.]|nr:allophanate hydrolase [Luminiphilus sp.]MDA9722033.1 allophanate hydrolase [Luminiphilus sp.]
MNELPELLDLSSLELVYRSGASTPRDVVRAIYARAEALQDHNVFIHQPALEELEPFFVRLEKVDPSALPLYGVPFLVKDNIDVEGMPTTAGCRAYSRRPKQSAYVVQQLVLAGAIPIGKTNMDQFATGLVGTRSPDWGVCRNALDPDWISGGSSSGSAVGVALGLATFSLGTDTAGSGRVPAMLNNIVGLKPSRGLLGMTGVVPACRSLDCPSIFSLTALDARRIFDVVAVRDPDDAWSRTNPFNNTARCAGMPSAPLNIAVPVAGQREFFGDSANEICFSEAIDGFAAMGAQVTEVDIEPLLQAAKLLYEGPWVAERYLVLEHDMDRLRDSMDETVRSIVEAGAELRSVDAWRAFHSVQESKRVSEQIFLKSDVLMLPTAPTTYRVDALLQDPVALNSRMGHYTNFMNLLDLCGVAVPVGFNGSNRPFGVTLIAPACHDQKVLALAEKWQSSRPLPLGATDKVKDLPSPNAAPCADQIHVAVCGAHMQRLPLNWQLIERGGVLAGTTQTSDNYRFFALADGIRPGLIRDTADGAAIAVEVWSIPAGEFGDFVAGIPWPLGIGKVELGSGEWVCGFVCDPSGLEGAQEITSFGSWRDYLAGR